MNINDQIQDRSLSALIKFQKKQRSQTRRLSNILRESYKDVITQINSENLTEYQARRLNKLAKNIQERLRAAYKALGEDFDVFLYDMVDSEIESNVSMLNKVVGTEWAAVPSTATVYSAAYARPFQGKLLREYYKDLPDSIAVLVKQQMRIGYVGGETTSQVVARVNRVLKGRSQNFNRAVIQTAMTHFRGFALNKIYEANSIAIKGIKWNATLDTKTSDFCMSNDQRVFQVGKVPAYPNHFNERSVLTAELKKASDQKFDVPERTRASMDGQVSDKLNYRTWLDGKSFSTKSDALGITRAKINKEGVAVQDMFVNNRLLNLSEIRDKFPTQYAAATG